MSDQITTSGGAAVHGNVNVEGGEFIGRDRITINVVYPSKPFVIDQPDLAQLRADYLQYLLDTYTFLDFRGTSLLEAIEKASGLALEDVYVPLLARPEIPAGETWLRIAGRQWHHEIADDEHYLIEHEMLLRIADRQRSGENTDDDNELLDRLRYTKEPLPIDGMLDRAQALVILGDPGSGKSTVLKMLTLALAHQINAPLPILIPLTAYAETLEHEAISLDDYLPRYYASRQGHLNNLGPLFEAALAEGQAVVLLDGLDEVQSRRQFVMRLVEDFVREHVPEPSTKRRRFRRPQAGNRVVVTSRFVGYREAPMTDVRWATYALVDWEREEIARFIKRWTFAVELAVAGGNLTEQVQRRAEAERTELWEAITSRAGIERLAGNPLLLTILALIKRQGITLPHRRVELYELYLRTLISSWSKARSLDKRPVGPEIDYLEAVQILAPLAVSLREENPEAGLIHQPQLLDRFTKHYEDEGLTRAESRKQAREFLDAVHRYSNLLIERGPDQYGFIHLTLEEYLAGKGLISPFTQESINRIIRHISDPAWHETLLLAIGALGIVSQQPASAGMLVNRILDLDMPETKLGTRVILAGEALQDIGKIGLGMRTANRVIQALVETMQNAEVEVNFRQKAGFLLGELGWQPDDLDNFVEVPPGKFLYGDKKQEIEIKYHYWIAKYPVTNLQYKQFIDAGGYHDKQWWSNTGWQWRVDNDYTCPRSWHNSMRNNPIFPVVDIAWFEAEAYANWLNNVTHEIRFSNRTEPKPISYAVRLATEQEWERAARGTDGRGYPWEGEFDFTKAHVGAAMGNGDSAAVCTYPQGSSPVDAWDMIGNASEWMKTIVESKRVLRGGSWIMAENARCAYRHELTPNYFTAHIGFRVVLSLADSEI